MTHPDANARLAAGATKAVTLSQTDSYDLIQWMLTRKWAHGETAAQVLECAKKELRIEGLNQNHIRFRMDEFKGRLPIPKVPELTIAQRLERAEKGLALYAKWMMTGDLSAPDRAWLADLYNCNEVGVV